MYRGIALALGLLVTPAAAGFNKYECEDIKSYYQSCAEEHLDEDASAERAGYPKPCLPEQRLSKSWVGMMYDLERWHGMNPEPGQDTEFQKLCHQVCGKKLTAEQAYSHFCPRPNP